MFGTNTASVIWLKCGGTESCSSLLSAALRVVFGHSETAGKTNELMLKVEVHLKCQQLPEHRLRLGHGLDLCAGVGSLFHWLCQLKGSLIHSNDISVFCYLTQLFIGNLVKWNVDSSVPTYTDGVIRNLWFITQRSTESALSKFLMVFY